MFDALFDLGEPMGIVFGLGGIGGFVGHARFGRTAVGKIRGTSLQRTGRRRRVLVMRVADYIIQP